MKYILYIYIYKLVELLLAFSVTVPEPGFLVFCDLKQKAKAKRFRFVTWQRNIITLLTSFSLQTVQGLMKSEQLSLPSRQRHNKEHEFGVNLATLTRFLIKWWVDETPSLFFLKAVFLQGKWWGHAVICWSLKLWFSCTFMASSFL